MNRLRCWLDGFAGTWLDPGMWATRIRVLLTPGGPPSQWPGVVYSGHLHDTDHPWYVVDGDREHEWMRCARCGAELYCGWRRFWGVG